MHAYLFITASRKLQLSLTSRSTAEIAASRLSAPRA